MTLVLLCNDGIIRRGLTLHPEAVWAIALAVLAFSCMPPAFAGTDRADITCRHASYSRSASATIAERSARAIEITHHGATSTSTISLKDGAFKSWTFGSWGTGSAGGVMTVTTAIGNPPPALQNTTNTPSGDVGFGYGLDTAFSSAAPLEGRSFKLKVTFKSGPGAFGQGQGVQIIIAQNGSIYSTGSTFLGVTNVSNAWKSLTFKGVLKAADFILIAGTGPGSPDFVSGVPTQFGFGGGNYQSGTLTNYYDRFDLMIT